MGAVVHTWGSAGQSDVSATEQSTARSLAPTVGQLGSPVFILVVGALLLYKLHGLPTSSWDELSSVLMRLFIFQQQGLMPVALLMIARSLCWLIAWGILCVMVYRAVVGAALALRRFSSGGPSTGGTRFITSAPFEHVDEERLELDVRVLRQLGVTPYALASLKRKDAQLSKEKLMIQRRRRDRRERLSRGRVDDVQVLSGTNGGDHVYDVYR